MIWWFFYYWKGNIVLIFMFWIKLNDSIGLVRFESVYLKRFGFDVKFSGKSINQTMPAPSGWV